MWEIIRTEFRYVYKMNLLLAGVIIPGSLLYMSGSPTAGISVMLFPLSAGIILQLMIYRAIEKRERQQVLLPLSIRQLALARTGLVIGPTLAVYGIYLFLWAVFKDFNPAWWRQDILDLFMFFGLLLVGFSVYLILRDLFLSHIKNYRASELDIIILMVIILAVLLGIPLALANPRSTLIINSLRILCFVCGLVILYPATVSFIRRKSYRE